MHSSSTGDSTPNQPLSSPIASSNFSAPPTLHKSGVGPDPRYTAQELYRDRIDSATDSHADTETPNFNFAANTFDGSPDNDSSPHQATIPDNGSSENQASPQHHRPSLYDEPALQPKEPGRPRPEEPPTAPESHLPEPSPAAAPGRPADKDKATKIQTICATIRDHGYSDTAAAAKVEVTRSTVSRWKQDEEIQMLFDKARAEYQEPRLARIDDKRMKDGQHDWRAQAWLVKFSQPEEYGRPSSRRKLQDVILPVEKTPEEVAEEEKEKKVAELVEGFAGWHVFPQTGVCYAEMETIQQMKQEVWLYHLWGLQDSEDGETDPAKAVEGATHLAAALRVEAELEHAENIFRAQMGAPLVDDELRAKRAAKRLANYEKSGRFPRDPSIPAYAHCIPKEPKNVANPPIITVSPSAGHVTHAANAAGAMPAVGPGPVPTAPGRAGVSPAEAGVPPASPHVDGGSSRETGQTTIGGPGEDARPGGRDARTTRDPDALRASDAPQNVAIPPIIPPPEGGTRRIRRREIRAARLALAWEKARANSARRVANQAKYDSADKQKSS